MTEHFSPSQTLRKLRSGPFSSPPPPARDVAIAATKHPNHFVTAMRGIFYTMTDSILRYPGRDMSGQFAKFSNGWRGVVNADEDRFFFGSLDAYSRASKVGIRDLDWQATSTARTVATELTSAAPGKESIEGLAWQVLIGQVQSLYSRDDAAATFASIRDHRHGNLVQDFYRDNGALTYYSGGEIQQRRRDLPSLAEMQTWQRGHSAKSEKAILVSVDPNFFRIYAPMVLHTAQQLPDLDFVIVLCALPEDAEDLHDDSEAYLSGLSRLNGQNTPSNVRLKAISTPDWIGAERTFFACARFLALPGVLEEYESIYAIDADLFMLRDPRPFMDRAATHTLGVPRTDGPLGVSPWRRYMAGNVAANRNYLNSPMMPRLNDYLSVGLSESASWMLDQNALAYAVEAIPNYRALSSTRPTSVGGFMDQWEKNFRAVKR